MSAPIGIVCATQSEIAPFLKAMDVVSTDKKAMVEMHRGTFGGCDVVATCCGICKTNAAMAVQSMIDSYGVSCVINAGRAAWTLRSMCSTSRWARLSRITTWMHR